jgi:hypothetical protein
MSVSGGKYAMTCVFGKGPSNGVIFLYHFLSGRAIIVILLGSIEAAKRAQCKTC